MTAAANAPAQSAANAADVPRTVRIYEYSDLVYWWAIWVAALACIGLSYFGGAQIVINDKAVWVASSPWVGIGFLVVMFATLIFTQLRARGIYAIILVLACALIGLIVHMWIGWHAVFDQLTLLKVYMNLAFYAVFFAVSFVIWFYTFFIHARLTYGVINPGEVGWRSPLTSQIETYRPLNFQVTKRSDDLIVHKLLGLRWLGVGTGDIEVKFDVPGGGSQHHVFKNVLRPDAQVDKMEALITTERR